MTNQHMKGCSILLAIREISVKTTAVPSYLFVQARPLQVIQHFKHLVSARKHWTQTLRLSLAVGLGRGVGGVSASTPCKALGNLLQRVPSSPRVLRELCLWPLPSSLTPGSIASLGFYKRSEERLTSGCFCVILQESLKPQSPKDPKFRENKHSFKIP